MKVAFITGSNRGLGLGFVQYLSLNGWQVFAGMRDITRFKQGIKNVTPIQLDVSNDESIKQAFQKVSAKVDTINLLINNAGSNKKSATNGKPDLVCKLPSLDREKLLDMFSTNAIGPLMVTKTFLSLLNAAPSYVFNISSDRASFHDEIPNSSANYGYRASKVALNMMTFCSVDDLPRNVKTAAVHPGSVLTDMNPAGDTTPQEQAEKIVSLTERWQEEWNGKFLRANGEYYPL
jgi:NAD(P)-dependent dehydrogenase (short-subunit alcohol dehydrogenase family)